MFSFIWWRISQYIEQGAYNIWGKIENSNNKRGQNIQYSQMYSTEHKLAKYHQSKLMQALIAAFWDHHRLVSRLRIKLKSGHETRQRKSSKWKWEVNKMKAPSTLSYFRLYFYPVVLYRNDERASKVDSYLICFLFILFLLFLRGLSYL